MLFIPDFPTSYKDFVESELNTLKFKLSAPRDLAQAVLRLSNHFIDPKGKPTPWHEPWAKAAYLTYYFPLNWARAAAAALRCQEVGFFSGSVAITEIGSGSGSASLALAQTVSQISQYNFSESSKEAITTHQRLWPENLKGQSHWACESFDEIFKRPMKKNSNQERLLFLSYSLNEILSVSQAKSTGDFFKRYASYFQQFDSVLFIEPSTHQYWPHILETRESLKALNYSLWAPCTHQELCPFRDHDLRHWCHDRVHWRSPDWFKAIEAHLPMKNETLTFSYLAFKKTAPQQPAASRIISDDLREKGRTLWWLCHSDKKQDMAWLTRNGDVPPIKRGDRLLHDDLVVEKKANYWQLRSLLNLPKDKD